jgi:HNH endonuclease
MSSKPPSPGHTRLDQLVADTHRNRDARELGYREQALKLYPWICGRCRREFTRENLHELTVHHRDHNHDNNPEDGSNWELLCLYCHDNEHQRLLEAEGALPAGEPETRATATHNPFADLKALLKK